MRTLTSNVTTEVAGYATRPGYLVQVDFAFPLRLSSRGDIFWNSQMWAKWDIRITGLAVDGAQSAQNGSITLGNTDYTVGALVLAEGVAGRALNVWKVYGETPDTPDPVLVFSGVCDDSSIDPDSGDVTINLQQQDGATLYSPRTYINRASGFSFIPANGTIIQWNGETFVLKAD